MANNSLYPDRTLGTRGYHGYNIKFSPFDANILAVSGAENFGIRGRGCLISFNLLAEFPLIKQFLYCDALFDLCWLKSDGNVIVTGAGDGCIQIWSVNGPTEAPVSCKKIHAKEVSSIDCCQFSSDYVVTSSWDSSVALCEVNRLLPLCILRGHNGIVYEAALSRVDGKTLASVSEDGTALIWSPFADVKPSLSLPAVGAELLSCDWSSSNPYHLATASADAVIYGWDLRAPGSSLFQLHGHENAIRKVRFSPFISTELVSVSYDFTTRLWDTSYGLESSLSRIHSEFVYGVDYSSLKLGVIADCSWDQMVQVYRVGPRQTVTSIQGGRSFFLPKGHYCLPSFTKPLPPAARSDLAAAFPNQQSRPLPPLPELQLPQAESPSRCFPPPWSPPEDNPTGPVTSKPLPSLSNLCEL